MPDPKDIQRESSSQAKTTNHMPWDEGSIADMFLGLVAPYKTTKTQCGIRVKISTADHKASTTCPDCLTEMARRHRGAAILSEYSLRLERDGFESANAWAKSEGEAAA